jgi:hypothetical protein
MALLDRITPKELALMIHNLYGEEFKRVGVQVRKKEDEEFRSSSTSGKILVAVCTKVIENLKD